MRAPPNPLPGWIPLRGSENSQALALLYRQEAGYKVQAGSEVCVPKGLCCLCKCVCASIRMCMGMCVWRPKVIVGSLPK